jgi:hypothetical protein
MARGYLAFLAALSLTWYNPATNYQKGELNNDQQGKSEAKH